MSEKNGVPFFWIDAFTDRAFGGNPAVVCLLESLPANAWLQSVAMEMNQSETAFIVRSGDHFDLRWFTPAVEVDLCGHATLAAAFAVWHSQRAVQSEILRFSTRSGILTARRHGDAIELNFPIEPQTEVPCPANLAEALSVEPRYVGRSRFDYLVEVDSESRLRAMTPDFRRLATIDTRGVIVTSPSSDARFDFVSRFFAPASGIDEDPVTGSAHCTLAEFWTARLGKSQFNAYQASPRGGALQVRIDDDRVTLAGRATLVAHGNLIARAD